MKHYTCPICDDKIPLIPDGRLKKCACDALGVDCTDLYIRTLGVYPKEDDNYDIWYESRKETIEKLRELYKSKIDKIDKK